MFYKDSFILRSIWSRNHNLDIHLAYCLTHSNSGFIKFVYLLFSTH